MPDSPSAQMSVAEMSSAQTSKPKRTRPSHLGSHDAERQQFLERLLEAVFRLSFFSLDYDWWNDQNKDLCIE